MMSSRLRALRVVHPFPSLLNAALVVVLAAMAGGTAVAVALLGAGMLGIQFCIGATNDVVDVALDAHFKPWKPIPAGLVTRASAVRLAAVAGVLGIAAATVGGPLTVAMALVMLGCGLVYDLWLKPTIWAWTCFSVAFALLPVYAWYGAVGTLPPRIEFLVLLAVVAGPMLHVANGLVDLEPDGSAGLVTLATRLGLRRAAALNAGLLAALLLLAWLTLSVSSAQANVVVMAGAALGVGGNLLLSAQRPTRRQLGWSLQALAVAMLGIGWLFAVS